MQTIFDKPLDKQVTSNTQAIANKINTSDIANNLTTTTAGKVLDARQGKALNDAIDSIFPPVRVASNGSPVTLSVTHEAGLLILRRPNTVSNANCGLYIFVKQNATVNLQLISNSWTDTTVTGGSNQITISTTYVNGIACNMINFGEA